MIFKPFRPPTLNRTTPTIYSNSNPPTDAQPPAKKRRISDQNGDDDFEDLSLPASSSKPRQIATPTFQAPLRPSSTQLSFTPKVEASSQTVSDAPQAYYNILWRKVTNKKHKTWEGDGVLSVRNGFASLQDETGREMGRIPHKSPLLEGSMLHIGGKEVEVQSMISKEHFLAGRPFLGAVGKPTVRELDEKLQTNIKFNSPVVSTPRNSFTKPQQKFKSKKGGKNAREDEEDNAIVPPVAPPLISQGVFKTPLLHKPVQPQVNSQQPVPRFDPHGEGALVMKRPTHVPKGKQIVDVVVDPTVACHLREHQREGVKFMYECVMGMRPDSGVGAILADEMGLGKTLQVIALLWTLLRQSPIYNEKSVIKKALIVCPVTLIKNWKKEIQKWLGRDSVGVYIVDDDKARIRDFTHGRCYEVMIIGYERLRNVQEELRQGTGIDIVIADEGHRMKTAKNKSAEAIKSLATERRIILSGTPLQNDLSEFYAMVDFVNPGLLGKLNAFKKEFETPIIRSRQPDATEEMIEKGQARSQELARLTNKFIIRRTAEILSKFLPPKTEYVLFCKPTETQVSIYRKIIASPIFGTVLGQSDMHLQLITVLKKVCNSPSLLQAKDEGEENLSSTVASLLSGVPASLLAHAGSSGKIRVLDSLLHRIRTTSEEKVVIVSHYTSTLDVIGKLLNSLEYKWLRLDGSIPASKRQKLVDQFNATDAESCFAFLLSAKSGGVGLNLIGASRLILFDIDWNPSTELQAMARIHRDGQKRPCYIYRMLTKGALDEKIYQRQITKLSLADSIVDNKDSKPSFTPEELRDLFTLNESEACQTHELLGCSCGGRGTTSTTDIPVAPVEDDSSDDDAPLLPRMIKAPTLADIEAVEKRHAREQKNKKGNDMSVLMRYQHVNANIFSPPMTSGDDAPIVQEDREALVEDEMLLSVLKDSENRVPFLFAKTSA